MDECAFSFGPFRLLVSQRLLLEGDKPVRLGSRAFDILAALVEHAGEVVGKEELIARVWPQTFVEEANLKIQVSALRRALGDGQSGHRYIATIPGRGYNFVASVGMERAWQPRRSPAVAPVAAGPHNLPHATTRMIGRDDAVLALVSRLPRQRLVTIVGPGGIGKTTVALAVAERVVGDYDHGVWLVDLAPLADPRLVPSAIATVLGLEISSDDPLPRLLAYLANKQMLLLLDTCEHVIDATADLVAALLRDTPRVSVVATSRESLKISGESRYQLGPLGSPQPSPVRTAAETGRFPAVQLFVERVTGVVEDFVLTDANAPLVGEICRRLDGLPLAIEFAAPRVEVLGIEGLASDLDSLALLGAHRRAEVSRHQTMRAVLDWSYGLLTDDERRFFRSLGIFAGDFTIEAAAALASNSASTRGEAIDRLADLVTRSLVVADVSGERPWFRLLDTTRAYAIEKLGEGGERGHLERSRAEHYLQFFAHFESESEQLPAAQWLAACERQLDDLRAALGWAFSPGGDSSLGVALTAAAVPVWTHLSLMEECRSSAERALAACATGVRQEPATLMKLHAALAMSVMSTRSIGAETGSIWTTTLELAEELGDGEYQLRSLWGLWLAHRARGQHALALELARRFCTVADTRSERNDRLVGECMVGETLHFLGSHADAERHLERVIGGYGARDRRSSAARFLFDPRVSARIAQARILWLQGYPDRAMRTAAMSVEDARATENAISLCLALAHAACPIALWTGDEAAADEYISMLTDHAADRALPQWHARGFCYAGMLALSRGDPGASVRLLQEGLDALEAAVPGLHYGLILASFALGLGRAGRFAEALGKIDDVIARAERTGEHWLTPELLRTKGELLSLQDGDGAADIARTLYEQALKQAKTQGARSWELRAATSLARLLHRRDRPADAYASLAPIYSRFTEGLGTADLMAARRYLDDDLRTPAA